MKVLGFFLIVVGIIMILIRGFNVPVKTNVVNLGPIEISKKESRWIGWPTYAGGLLAVIGVVMVVTDKKR
jgi:drug/metabolite transporter (DMT)-like permease